MLAMPELSLLHKNLLFLETADPDLAEIVRANADTLTRCVLDPDGLAIDIDLGTSRLYGRSAEDFAAEQVASWSKAPTRVVFNPPAPAELSDECTRTLSR